MENKISLDDLKARLDSLNQEREALEKLIAIYEGQPVGNSSGSSSLSHRTSPTSFSVRGRVVDAIIDLIHEIGRQVTNKEILENLEKRGISLGDTKNKQTMLAAMLSQEADKNSARLRKVARGVWDIKK